jgi:MvaI/BcnI restriction endonuclease family
VLEKSDTDVSKALAAFTRHDIDVTLLVPTQTGLNKAIMDATANVRDYLLSKGFHDYEKQAQGPENKVVRRAFFLEPDSLSETTVSLYRPQTKSGDPRIWFARLGQYAEPYNLLAIFDYNNDLYVVNASRNELVATLEDPTTPLGDIATKLKKAEDPIVGELLEALKAISSKGYIRTLRPGDTGVGMTLESLLGITANADKTPDFKGIELKAKRIKKSPTRATLFSQSPDWKLSPARSAWNLLNTFGYHRDGKLRLNCEINAKAPNSLGFILDIDVDRDWLRQNHIKELGETASHIVTWPLEVLRGRLREKHPKTFWVGARCKGTGADEHFHYIKVEYTREPSVRNFQALLESGVISVDYLMSQRDGKQLVRDHGYLFKIAQKDFPALFPPSAIHVLA